MKAKLWIAAVCVMVAGAAQANESLCGYQGDMTDFAVAQRLAGIGKAEAKQLWEQNGPRLSDPANLFAAGVITNVTFDAVYGLSERQMQTDQVMSLGDTVYMECLKGGGQ